MDNGGTRVTTSYNTLLECIIFYFRTVGRVGIIFFNNYFDQNDLGMFFLDFGGARRTYTAVEVGMNTDARPTRTWTI